MWCGENLSIHPCSYIPVAAVIAGVVLAPEQGPHTVEPSNRIQWSGRHKLGLERGRGLEQADTDKKMTGLAAAVQEGSQFDNCCRYCSLQLAETAGDWEEAGVCRPSLTWWVWNLSCRWTPGASASSPAAADAVAAVRLGQASAGVKVVGTADRRFEVGEQGGHWLEEDSRWAAEE